MRLIKLITIASIALLFSCGNSNTPEKTVREFYKAIKAKDYQKAKELSSEKSKSIIGMMGESISLNFEGGEIKNIDCVTEDNISNCDCFLEGKEKPIPVSLVKQNDAWKVDLQSSVMNGLDNLLNGFKDVDVNGLMEQFGGLIKENSDKINEVIDNIDPEEVSKLIKGADSSLNITKENIEELMEAVEKNVESEKGL